MRAYDPALNSAKSYGLAIETLREICVRRGQVRPSAERPDEARWAREGDRPIAELDTVRKAS